MPLNALLLIIYLHIYILCIVYPDVTAEMSLCNTENTKRTHSLWSPKAVPQGGTSLLPSGRPSIVPPGVRAVGQRRTDARDHSAPSPRHGKWKIKRVKWKETKSANLSYDVSKQRDKRKMLPSMLQKMISPTIITTVTFLSCLCADWIRCMIDVCVCVYVCLIYLHYD